MLALVTSPVLVACSGAKSLLDVNATMEFLETLGIPVLGVYGATEAFSIGFGPILYKKQIGETEWRVSAVPLGGYVKLFGEEPDTQVAPEERKRALQYAAPWKRFFIFAGGPFFNFFFAIYHKF